MALCDSSLERTIRSRHYDILNTLSPLPRFIEKFRLSLEALTVEIRKEDRFLGWFSFLPPQPLPDYKAFADEIPGSDILSAMEAPNVYASRTNLDRGHTLVDYGFILQNGLIAYEHQIQDALKKDSDNSYLFTMASCLSTVKAFSDRMANKVEFLLSRAPEDDRPRLSKILSVVKKVPYYPADDLQEAIQSIWMIHFLLPLAENAWYSISLGRLDQYLYPYYQKALSDQMPESEIKAIFYQFYQLLNEYADGACALNVGGEDYNELSLFLVNCQKEFALPAPILCARVTKETPEHIWNLLIDPKLFSRGQPTFYGEESCRNALIQKGLPPEKAACFTNNSCMGISIAGTEFNSMWGCVMMIPAALELACNRGRFLKGSSGVFVPGIEKPRDYNSLFDAFRKAVTHLTDVCVASYETKADWFSVHDPDPFVSLLTADSIASGCDRIKGARYHNVTVECMGMINTADGLYAIDRLVYREKKYTLDEINQAVKADFKGFEHLQKDLLSARKFGENGEADLYAQKVAALLADVISGHNHGKVYYCPSLHTLDANVGYGSLWGAGYDGRNAFTPLAKNAGPSNKVRTSDPTSMILSSASLPQCRFYGGQPLDVNFPIDLVLTQKAKIATLIKVYLERGGLQFQVNALSSALLRDATDHPEKYPHLVVRIGGYSILFNRISRQSKEEFIERFAKEGY